MVTSPVMEVEVATSIPARSVPLILSGELQAQLPVHVTPLEIVHNMLSMTKLKSKQHKQPPHNNRRKRLLL